MKPWKEKYVQDGATMELTDHLDELRDRLIRSVAALVLGVLIIGLPFNGMMLDLLQQPMRGVLGLQKDAKLRLVADGTGTLRVEDPNLDWDTIAANQLEIVAPNGRIISFGSGFTGSLFYFSPVEPFLLRMKVAVWLGLIAALPVVMWQVFGFVAPGMNDREKEFLRPLLVTILVLFPLGSAFAFWSMKYALHFLMDYGRDLTPAISVSSYVNLTLIMMLLMGLVFQLPPVLLGLFRLGVLDPATIAKNRPYWVFGLFVVAAVLTPPDPFTMMAMGLPLWMLFELSLLMARLPIFRPRATAESDESIVVPASST